MRISLKPDYESVSRKTAQLIVRKILTKNRLVLGLPTGDTPKRMYEIMVDYHSRGLVDFSGVTTFNLDEYYPISRGDPKSFRHYMDQRLFDKVNLSPRRTNVPDGTLDRVEVGSYCEKYERKISEAGGIGLMVLGIGENGHIGFNEPGVDFATNTRLVDLKRRTIESNFDEPDQSPDEAITMGIKTIMNAREIILMAAGRKKRKAIEMSLSGTITNEWPASVLQLHPNVSVILDGEAGEGLPDEKTA